MSSKKFRMFGLAEHPVALDLKSIIQHWVLITNRNGNDYLGRRGAS